MSVADPQLALLQMAERLAHERFIRLSATNGMPDHPEVVQAAKHIWNEAAAAVLAHKRK
ncbi:MAG TPA: hypothetical protein VK641_16410 [Terriglobales bacterium]|jgi:hypothetical protein|nr:hypothetical protein [Terriglobales bacterium]